MTRLFLPLAVLLTLTVGTTAAQPLHHAAASSDIIVLSTPAAKWPGKIFVNHDEWAFSDYGFLMAPDAHRFALNIVNWFTNGRPGRFLVYSQDFGLTGGQLAATMTGARHSWTVNTGVEFDLPTLLGYDAVFLAGSPADNAVLIDYVRAGGNVYLAGGTGWGGSVAEAARWNTFLNAFGLQLQPFYYYGLWGIFPVSWQSPIFDGSLFQGHGSPVDLVAGATDGASILARFNGYGLYATYATQAVAVPVDIKPGACPNRLIADNRGVVHAAILSSDRFDANSVAPSSVRLLGVAPHHHAVVDVSGPSGPPLGKTSVIDCPQDGPDGYPDLKLMFDTQEVIDAIEATLGRSVQEGDVFALTLTGNLTAEMGGHPIVGEDLVIIMNGEPRKARAPRR